MRGIVKWDEWRGSLDGRPSMWIKRLLKFRGWRLDLHKFVAPDDPGCFHTHPANAFRFILRGGYLEEVLSGAPYYCKAWTAGKVGMVRPPLCHRVAGLKNGKPAYTLWLRGPKIAEVELHGDGWGK